MNEHDVTLTHGAARASIALAGAQAMKWSIADRELLWSGDPAIWGQISPILYPVVGQTSDGVRVAGRRYPLGLHGFAPQRDFVLEASRPDFARLVLRSDAQTLVLYPFEFQLAVEYRLGESSFEIAMEVANPGAGPAPYTCGLHPGFRWPFAGSTREGAYVRFEREERAEVPVMTSGGLIAPETRAIPLHGRDLALDDDLFAHGALCLLNIASRSLRFVDASGAAIEMVMSDFPHVAFWSKPGAGYVCLEPRTGYADPHGFTGDLFEKPSTRVLRSGETARHAATFTFIPA
ncbi:MAG: aldose 1-epimerase family protein [Ancalomicrobiaceae bacterium]|nr:aldose 1-epimerase family protein [Ancalomicrobiaceae bacterium]